jgi:hypothetical protein
MKVMKKYEAENSVYIIRGRMADQKIDSLVNLNKQLITTQKIVTSADQVAINTLSDEVFKLSKKDNKNTSTIALLKTNQQVIIDSLNLIAKAKPKKDSLIREDILKTKDSSALLAYIRDTAINPPATFSFEDSTISATATVLSKTNMKIDSIYIPNVLNQRIVKKDGGFWKKDTYEFQSFNTSKYIHTINEQSLLFVPEKEKGKIIKYLIAAGIGALTITLIK